jgi:hypothetical protein
VYPVPRTLRLLSLAISAAVLASAVVGAALALLAPVVSPSGHVVWVLAGFEVVTIVAAVLGVLLGLGRFAEGPGLALACVSGTILVASTLAWQGSAKNFLGVSLTPFLMARAAAAMALALIGAACVLGRDPRAWRWALTGAALAAPAVLVAGSMVTDKGQRLLALALGSSAVQQIAVGVIGGVAIAGLFAAGGHMLIRAFELGRTNDAAPGSTSSRSA